MISHAIFASSHPTSTSHRASPHLPPCTPFFTPLCLPLCIPHLTPHLTLHSTPRSTPPLTLPLALPPTLHSTLHSTLRSPAPTPHPIMHFFAPHDSHSQVPPVDFLVRKKALHSAQHSASYSALRPTSHFALNTSLHSATPHPIMHFTLRLDPIPNHSFPSHFFAPQDSLSQVPPVHITPSSSRPPISHPRLSIPPCPSAKSSLWIFSCVKRPGSLTT